MDYREAIARLLNHANFPESEPVEESFLHLLWKAQRDRLLPDLTPSVSGIIQAMEVVNRTVNGPAPSHMVSGKCEAFDRNIVWAVASILHFGWQYLRDWTSADLVSKESLAELQRHLWRMSCAWLAILDGDIDNLEEHTQLEDGARDEKP